MPKPILSSKQSAVSDLTLETFFNKKELGFTIGLTLIRIIKFRSHWNAPGCTYRCLALTWTIFSATLLILNVFDTPNWWHLRDECKAGLLGQTFFKLSWLIIIYSFFLRCTLLIDCRSGIANEVRQASGYSSDARMAQAARRLWTAEADRLAADEWMPAGVDSSSAWSIFGVQRLRLLHRCRCGIT